MNDDEVMNFTLQDFRRALKENNTDFITARGLDVTSNTQEVFIYARGKSAKALEQFLVEGGLEEKLEA